MACFTHYWEGETCDCMLEEESEPLNHTAVNLFRQRGVSHGDKLYVVNVLKGELYLVGRLRVDKIVSQSVAERLLKRELWPASEHLMAMPGSESPMRFERLIPLAVTQKLMFESGGGVQGIEICV